MDRPKGGGMIEGQRIQRAFEIAHMYGFLLRGLHRQQAIDRIVIEIDLPFRTAHLGQKPISRYSEQPGLEVGADAKPLPGRPCPQKRVLDQIVACRVIPRQALGVAAQGAHHSLDLANEVEAAGLRSNSGCFGHRFNLHQANGLTEKSLFRILGYVRTTNGAALLGGTDTRYLPPLLRPANAEA